MWAQSARQKKIAILGSTGSIGINTLEVIENLPFLSVSGLVAGKNVELLESQIYRFNPSKVAMMDEEKASELRKRLVNHPCKIWSGLSGIIEVATAPDVDLVVSAIVGAAGLIPTLEAIKAGKDIALANKETMVMAGEIVNELVKEIGVNILPVDSEHNAVFQILEGRQREDIEKIILTASGGPFRDRKGDFEGITPEEALAHPRWLMGPKISIDSATLMNKGLEVIEAHYLFHLPAKQISVVIHPESIVHSLVEFIDGSMMAQLGITDMRVPISYCLTYPERLLTSLPKLSLAEAGPLHFFSPDLGRFPALRLALEVVEKGGSWPAVLNAANEAAVDLFLKEKIAFTNIPFLIEQVLERHSPLSHPNLEEILAIDRWARAEAEKLRISDCRLRI
ncbi:MAG: 1-deoxy-D-xylulose-5-phosphate reductoisomerase [bacterium]|nr:1-deoxy-D-xylulose-5-phosphate reductoisomerase [bacterium]